MRLEERERVQRRRQGRRGPVGRELPVPGVDEVLRLDGHGRLLVTGRHVEPLHLHVAQHLEPVAAVRAEERVVRSAGRCGRARRPGDGRTGRSRTRPAPSRDVGRQCSSRSRRRSARGTSRSGWSFIGQESRASSASPSRCAKDESSLPVGARAEPEPGPLQPPLAREHPVEPVHRPLARPRVRLHPADERRDDRRLRRAVRPVEEDDLVHPPGADEGAERAVQRRLDLLLPRHAEGARLGLERQVEQVPAAHLPDRRLALLRRRSGRARRGGTARTSAPGGAAPRGRHPRTRRTTGASGSRRRRPSRRSPRSTASGVRPCGRPPGLFLRVPDLGRPSNGGPGERPPACRRAALEGGRSAHPHRFHAQLASRP